MSEEIKTNLEEEDMDTIVTEEYSAKDIQVLEGLEAVRKRPGMYIGSTGPRGLHHLVYEIVDNSIDEALAGVCTHIECDILPGDIIQVRDNGRGIPTGINEKTGLPAVTVVLTTFVSTVMSVIDRRIELSPAVRIGEDVAMTIVCLFINVCFLVFRAESPSG